MKISELLIEKIVGTVQRGKFNILVNDHAFDRLKERGVPYTVIDPILKKIYKKLEFDIDSIEPGQQFWVYDDSYVVSLGFRKYDNHGDTIRIVLNTTLASHPGDKVIPVFELY